MKKQDIKEGAEYFAAEGRTTFYSGRRVLVVENEAYYKLANGTISKGALYRSKRYQKAHLAWALTEAFPNDSTPNEAKTAAWKMKEVYGQVVDAYYEAHPMAQYRKGNLRYGHSGILCKSVNDEGIAGDIVLVPRGEIRMTWAEHVRKDEADKLYRAEAAKAQAAKQAVEAAQRQAIEPMLKAAFEDSGVAAPYVWSNRVELSLEQMLVLLNAIKEKEEVK
jgi:hypothetical protein